MPTSIPYDHPSLVLGNIIDPAVLAILKNISSCQAKIDAAQDQLNSFIMMKRSIAMTINELTDMNVDVSELKNRQPEIDQSITKSAGDYLTARITNESQIQKLREQLSNLEIKKDLESPVDFSRSTLTTLPLSSESLKLDSQYFSFGSDKQDDTIASIEKYVLDSTSNMGGKSGELAGTVSSQVSRQLQNHSVAGTLIITASCTHSYVKLFEPLVLDPDKAISIWNEIQPSYKIDTEHMTSGTGTANDSNTDISILAGAGYGSSFIGMVHILNSNSSTLAPDSEIKQTMDEKLRVGGWLENAAGGFGVNESFMTEVKNLLNSQSVTSHVSIVVMGSIPSIASNQLKAGISKLAEFDPALISFVSPVENDQSDSIDWDAEKAKNGAQILNMQNAKIQTLLKGLGGLDQDANNVLDINSMMTAFENYLTAIKTKDENIGVPVSFNLKKISKSQIEQLWQDKYYPQKKVTTTGNNPG